MWKFIAVYFCGLSISITNLEAINVAENDDILNTSIQNRTNDSQISILDEFNKTIIPNHFPSNSTDDTWTSYETRKIVKRSTVWREVFGKTSLNIFGENINFEIELGPFGYCKIILFAISRIFFGIALDVSKVKQIFARSIGPIIAISCHCLFLPLVSDGSKFRMSKKEPT